MEKIRDIVFKVFSIKILRWMVKIITTVIILVIVFSIALDKIPIKYAVKSNKALSENEFLLTLDLKTGLDMNKDWWIAFDVWDYNYVDGIYVNLKNNASPFTTLNPKYFLKKEEHAFIVTGEIEDYREQGESYKYKLGVIDMEKWDIVYPIKRSNNRWFASDEYLTVYDLNWGAIIDSWLK